MWGFLFASFDCALVRWRGKESPVNAIIAGAATSGVLAIRQGKSAFITATIVGGLILAMIEGMMHLANRTLSPGDPHAMTFEGLPQAEPAKASKDEGDQKKQTNFAPLVSMDRSKQATNESNEKK